MATVLANPSTGSTYRGPARWPLSVEAYHTLGDLGQIPKRSELLHGIVYHKISKSPLHTLLVLRLIQLLQSRLPTDCHLRAEQPLTFADSEPEPDISIVQGSVEDFPKGHPTTAELVVEVCVTSHDYDRETLGAYANAGVKEVWLVLGPERLVEVYRRPEAGRYAESAVLPADGILASSALSGAGVRLPELFRE